MCKNNKYKEVESLDNSLSQLILSSYAKGVEVGNSIDTLGECLAKRDYSLKLNEINFKLVAKTALKYKIPTDFIINKAIEIFLNCGDEMFIQQLLFNGVEENLRKALSKGKFIYKGVEYNYFTYSLSPIGTRDVEVIFYDKEENILDVISVDLLDFDI